MYGNVEYFLESVQAAVAHAAEVREISWQVTARISEHFERLDEFINACHQIGRTDLVAHGKYAVACLDYGNDVMVCVQTMPVDEEDWSALGAPSDHPYGTRWQLPEKYAPPSQVASVQ